MTLYAIGDIHGQLAWLRWAHDAIRRDGEAHGTVGAPIVHLGDYTDRGPDSRGVIDYLIEGRAAGAPWLCVLGNHDRMFLKFLEDPEWHDPRLWTDLDWLHPRLGGTETLASYGITRSKGEPVAELHARFAQVVPAEHRAFLTGLKLGFETPDLALVHAGVRAGIPLADQEEDDLIWLRDEFLADETDHGHLIVHGHTVTDLPEHAGNRVNLDTGAGYGKPLTAAVFEGRDCFILTDKGREYLPPQNGSAPSPMAGMTMPFASPKPIR